jgi:hypothetical protein
MWSPPLAIGRVRSLGARIGFRPPMSSYDHFGDYPRSAIVAPLYSTYIVAGDTIFEQGLVAAPTATVRPAHVHPAFVVTQPGGHGTTPKDILVRRKLTVPRI